MQLISRLRETSCKEIKTISLLICMYWNFWYVTNFFSIVDRYMVSVIEIDKIANLVFDTRNSLLLFWRYWWFCKILYPLFWSHVMKFIHCPQNVHAGKLHGVSCVVYIWISAPNLVCENNSRSHTVQLITVNVSFKPVLHKFFCN